MKSRALLILFFISFVYPDSWTMDILSSNIDGSIPGDNITMGMCDSCSDGFHWGNEDIDDSPWGFDYTNIYFQHMDWFFDGQVNGLVDENNNPPTSGFYEQELKSTHPPEDLLIWSISGSCADASEPIGSFYLNWSVDTLATDYDIYLYIDDDPSSPINMRFQEFKQIDCDKLPYETIIINDSTYYWNSKIKILMGGCAGTPLATYYEDLDGDGWGSDMPSEFCYGHETEGWVSNSEDLDDSIYCQSNDIDSCDVCDGGNADMDCAGECGGNAVVDECGECGGFGAIYECGCEDEQLHCRDLDGDGWGTSEFTYTTCDVEGDVWVTNCDDLDDSIYCESNEFDCLGICDGSAVDWCDGSCSESGPIVDECGECGGDGMQNYYADWDGDNYGDCDADIYILCPSDVETWMTDICGDCNDTDSNAIIEDCAGECGGDAVEDCAGECNGYTVIDECGECGGPGAIFHCVDLDGDGWGTGEFTITTCDDLDDTWVTNCDDLDDSIYCESNVNDCEGICDGTAEFDDCGECDGNGTSCLLIGDLNDDGALDIFDIIAMVGMILDDEPYNLIADLNEDGSIDIFDVIQLVNLILNPPQEGCTDEEALNYDPFAILDDGSCVYETGLPSFGVIGYSFSDATPIGGGFYQIPISIMLWDIWANPVADSLPVYFTINPPELGYITSASQTANSHPITGDSWPGVAWAEIQYHNSGLFESPEIIAYTTGNICSDGQTPYSDCEANGYTWLTETQLQFSSADNEVSYQNVCADCEVGIYALGSTQHDFGCSDAPFVAQFGAALVDAYDLPAAGGQLELLLSGTQGNPTIEAYQFDGEEINLIPEPPSNVVLTDEGGFKYWQITFTQNECVQTGFDEGSAIFTCSTPEISANLVNPNGVQSNAISLTVTKTCPDY